MSDAVYVGIRTHNSSKTMDKTFQSVYNQTYPNLKLVVYDDHSTDDTDEKLSRWQDKFAGKGISVEVLSGSENLGCGKAFETLGRAVAGRMNNNDAFVIIDSDDTFTSENAIANTMVQMKKTGANVLIAGFQLQGDMDLVLNWNSGTPHNYFKHAGSVTVQARPEDFSVIRIGYLKTLQKIVKDNRESFVPSAEQHVNAFLETKYTVISSIVDKKRSQDI